MANLSNINNKFIVADVATATRVSIGITTTNNLLTLFGTGAGNATLQIEGEGGADPYINFLANNAQHWSLGVDDSDSDKFKLSEHSALGTNDYFVVDTSGKVGIGTTNPFAKLEVTGNLSNNWAGRFENTNSIGYGILAKINSTDSSDYIFQARTGSTNVMTILGDGNVGIGTDSPSQKLVVQADWNGSLSNNQQLQIQGNTDTTLQLRLGYDTTNDYAEIAAIKSGTGYKNLILNRGGANVGIGASLPGAKLEVKAADTASTTDYATKVIKAVAPLVGGYTGTKIISLLGGFDSAIHAVDFGYGYNTTGYDMILSTNDNTSGNPIERMRIDSAGNVGIGTDSPAMKIDVEDNSTTWAGRVLNTNANGAGLLVRSDATTANDTTVLGVYGDGGYKMAVKSGGNVGIGTTSPNARLEVTSGQAKTVTSGVEFARFGTSNEASNYATLTCEVKGAAAAADRQWIFQTVEAGVANAGNIAFQPSGGNVGIGTSSPDSPLHLSQAAANTFFKMEAYASTQGADAGINVARELTSGSSSNLSFWTNTGSALTQKLTIDSSGNVTIGTAAASDFVLALRGGVGGFFGWDDSTNKTILQAPNTRKLSLRVNSDTFGAGTEAILIDSNGSIGMGANSASYRLRVKSDATVDNGIYLSAGTGSGNHSLYIENQDSSAEFFAVRGDGEIRFNATSGHTFANTGIRFGTNAAANNLNYYGEGTWTPVIAHNDGTGVVPITVNAARYLRVGQLVYVSAYLTGINPNGNAGGSGLYYGIRGFPFQPENYGAWQIVYASSGITAYGGYSGAASLYFMANGTNGQRSQAHVNGAGVNAWGSNLTMMFNCVYNING